MWTNQPIYFAIVVIAALVWLKFGIYPIPLFAAAIILLLLWSRLKHSQTWRTDGYTVRVQRGFRDEAWIHYDEAGRTLSPRAEGYAKKKSAGLLVFDEKLYFPPDYANALSEPRIDEIQKRISAGLTGLKIRHDFVRTGWTSRVQQAN